MCNALEYERPVVLRLTLRSSPETTGTLRIVGDGLDMRESLSPEPREVRFTMNVPPGGCTIAFECDAPHFPNRRHWRFEVVSWRLEPAPASPEIVHGR